MKILAIDQALTGHCGFAVLEDDVLLTTVLETYKGCDTAREHCYRFGKRLQDLITEFHPEVVLVELVRIKHQNKVLPDVLIALSQIRGVVNVVVPKGTPVVEINTSSWKKATLGYGFAKKEDSIRFVEERYKAVLSEHECDAIGMALAFPKLATETNPNIIAVA